MLQRKRWILCGLAAVAGMGCFITPQVRVHAGSPDEVAYPAGFRRWVHVKTGTVTEGNPGFPRFAGMHHVYANAAAMEGYKSGTFPEGSVFVFDDLNIRTGPGVMEGGDRRQLDVMQKSAAGWVFGEFKGDSHTERSVTAAQAVKECAECHELSKRDHVFSKFVE